MNASQAPADLIDTLVPLAAADPLYACRHQRHKVVAATQGSHAAIFDPALPGLSMAERLRAAQTIAQLNGSASLHQHYAEQLTKVDAPAPEGPRLAAILAFTHTLTERPVEGNKQALSKLPAAGLANAEIVTLAQLISYVAYQVRLVAGLKAMAHAGPPAETAADATATPAEETTFVHPAHLPKPGEPLRINGYTSETLEWTAWLPVVDLDTATPAQLAVLDSSHPKARSSDYYRLLAHQPRILEQRSDVFNAIMYAPGGLSRAERELASAAVSRVNGCVYCCAVHAQRFEQLAKRNDVIAQLFTDPHTAGTSPRERALVQMAIELTQSPADFGSNHLNALRAAGLSTLETLDAMHAVAIFAWANRLMLNLGEPRMIS